MPSLRIQSSAQFFRAYLFSYMLVLGLTVGSLGLLMLQHLTGGIWGIVIRRPLEAASRNLWLVLVMFVPIVLGMKYLYNGNGVEYGWLNAPKTGEHALSAWQQTLTTGGYFVRAAIYFVMWFALTYLFNAWSKQQDSNPTDGALRQRIKSVAGPGIILYVLAVTFASIDWVMSISPQWASTIYGFIFVGSQPITAMCLMIITVVMLSRFEPFAGFLRPRHLHDLGGLLFAFNMLWAYSRFFAIVDHLVGQPAGRNQLLSHPAVWPMGCGRGDRADFQFCASLSGVAVAGLKAECPLGFEGSIMDAVLPLGGPILDDPAGIHEAAVPHWLDIVVPVALMGLWVGFYAMNLKQRPVLPLGDPKLEEVLVPHHEH